MAATAVTAAATLLVAKCSAATPPKLASVAVPRTAASFLFPQSLPKGLATAAARAPPLPPLTSAAIAAAVFSSLSSADAAFAAQQIADIAEGDSRGLALLIPIVPAIGWVLYNILQPALNQINRMSVKGVAVGIGLGFGMLLASTSSASAGELAAISEAAASTDNRGLLLLLPVGVAISWVLFNILQPALNQLEKMRSG